MTLNLKRDRCCVSCYGARCDRAAINNLKRDRVVLLDCRNAERPDVGLVDEAVGCSRVYHSVCCVRSIADLKCDGKAKVFSRCSG